MPAHPIAPPAPDAKRSTGWRTLSGLLLIAIAIYLMVEQAAFRNLEARLTAPIVHLVTTGRTNTYKSTIYFGIGTDDLHGINITTLCSTVVLIAPLIALAGVLLMLPDFSGARIAAGLAVALVLSAACNVARYAAATAAWQHWGHDGFDTVHRYLGSLLVIFGFAAAFLLLLRIATRQPQQRGPAE
jgi:exosortase/archaeosortase family protein